MNSREGLRLRTMRSLAMLVDRLAEPIVIFAIVSAILCVFYAKQNLKFTGNPNDLLESDASYHTRYLEYTREFRAEEDYVIVVSGKDFERNRQCIEWVAARLNKRSDLFKKVFYRIDFSELANRGLLFLEIEDLKEIERGISQFGSLLGKDTLKLDLNSMLATADARLDPRYMKQKENEQEMEKFFHEFVHSLNVLADRLEGKTEKKPVQLGNFIAEKSNLHELQKQQEINEYLALQDGQILIIQVPSPNQEASFGEHAYAIEPLKEIIEAARKEFPDLEIGLTGEPALSEDESQASTRDTTRSSIVTFVLIAALFVFSYRRITRSLLALLSLIIAVCWTLGFTTWGIGHLNILSITFIPMILGLGIDFGIQILGRYEEELLKGSDAVNAITNALMHTGNAILVGGSTTAAAFYTMCWNDFRGLAEMGLISGTGIILCLLGSLVLFPALLLIKDRKRTSAPSASPASTSNKISFFDRIVLDHPWKIILVASVITVLAIMQIPRIWFDYSLLNLQNPKLESVQFERRLIDAQGSRSVIFAAMLCNSLEEASIKAEKLKKLPTVQEVISLTEIIPKNQEEKLKIIAKIKRDLESIQLPKTGVKVNVPENIRVLTSLRQKALRFQRLSKQFGRKEGVEFFGKLIPPIDRALAILSRLDQKKAEQILTAYDAQLFGEIRKNLEWLKAQKVDHPITEKDVPKVLRDRYHNEKSGKILLEVYPKENVWDREPLTRFIKDLRSVDPNVTGTPVQNYEYIELLRKSYEKAAIYALIVIVILISLHFRTPKYVLPTLLPLGLGIIWTAGLMPVINLPFNPANIITLPLVIGIGVAYGVYAVDRYRENRSPALFSSSTGKAILLSAMTTTFGFGSLAFASHRGIASLGLLMTLGVAMCLITSLYVCPAILHVLGRRRIQLEPESKEQ